MEKRVFRILPATGNQALVTAGTQLYNLTTGALNILEGQIGIFDYYTKAAVNTASLGATKSIFFARRSGDTIVQSLKIDLKDVQSASKQCYVANQAEQWSMSWTRTDCNEEYAVKIQADSVEIMEALGHNFLEKTFTYKTDCCLDCDAGCGDGDCADLAANLVSVINADPDELFTAEVVVANDLVIDTATLDFDFAEAVTFTFTVGEDEYVFTGTFGTIGSLITNLESFLVANGISGVVTEVEGVITISNTNATVVVVEGTDSEPDPIDETIEATDSDSCPSILIEGNFKGIASFCGLNPDYVFPNGVALRVIPLDKFGCVATATKVQSLIYEQGSGYDWAETAEEASGLYQSSPYRFTPLIRPDDARFNLVNSAINYVSYVVSHHEKAEGAPSGHYFESELQTVILVPTTGSTTLTALDTAWNNLFAAGVTSC